MREILIVGFEYGLVVSLSFGFVGYLVGLVKSLMRDIALRN